MNNDTRQALAALVALKDMKDKAERGVTVAGNAKERGMCSSFEEQSELLAEYKRRKPIAWAAARAALSAQPVAGAVATDETGWLIEHSGEILPGAEQRAQVSWLRVQMKFNGYGAREFGFTHDANEALRFARREDAEAVLAMHLGANPPDWYSNPFSVTEHMWPAASQAQAAPAPEPSAKGEPVTDAAILEAATKMFPMWREDIQPRFVVEVGRAALALASAPSTQPPAVVEAVPLTDEQADALRRLWPAIEKAMGCLVFTAEQAGAVQADMNTVRHGIAPKAAQPVAGAVATEPSEEIQELRAQVEAWRKQCETLTNQVICCGVAARHPDATLTTRGAYAGKWNSPQAEEVRKLRAERDALLAASPQPAPSAQGEPVACDRDAPVCPWCDRQGWDICQHADDARTCGK